MFPIGYVKDDILEKKPKSYDIIPSTCTYNLLHFFIRLGM